MDSQPLDAVRRVKRALRQGYLPKIRTENFNAFLPFWGIPAGLETLFQSKLHVVVLAESADEEESLRLMSMLYMWDEYWINLPWECGLSSGDC